MLSILFLAGCATQSAPGPNVAGDYAGTWSGSNGMTGEVRLSLKDSGNGTWDAKVDITAQDEAVPTTVESVKVDQAKVELVFHYEAGGVVSRVKIMGQLNGAVLAGNYQISSSEKGKVTATGTWTATRVQ